MAPILDALHLTTPWWEVQLTVVYLACAGARKLVPGANPHGRKGNQLKVVLPLSNAIVFLPKVTKTPEPESSQTQKQIVKGIHAKAARRSIAHISRRGLLLAVYTPRDSKATQNFRSGLFPSARLMRLDITNIEQGSSC